MVVWSHRERVDRRVNASAIDSAAHTNYYCSTAEAAHIGDGLWVNSKGTLEYYMRSAIGFDAYYILLRLFFVTLP